MPAFSISRMARQLVTVATLSLLCVPASFAAVAARACPAEPMRVTRSIGVASDYHGTYPGLPDLCRMTVGGQPGTFYLGVWRSDWPGAGDAYPALKTVVAGPAGTTASFVTRSVPGLQWRDTFTNDGTVPLRVDGKTRPTIKIAHERQGIEGNTYHSIITSWRDVETGAVLKVVEDQIAGQSYGPATTWNATAIETLPR